MVRPPPFEVAGHGQCTFENAMRAYFDHIYVAWPEEVASLLDGTYNDIEVLEQFGQSLRKYSHVPFLQTSN
jgi:hypothetical protein